jgi:hypothetical protein
MTSNIMTISLDDEEKIFLEQERLRSGSGNSHIIRRALEQYKKVLELQRAVNRDDDLVNLSEIQ